MFAILTIGGKQYKVQKDDVIYVEKFDAKEQETVTFKDNILMVDTHIGKPFLNATVTCEVMKHGKQKKITIIKHISQKHHTKTQGHRQPYTKLLVKDITYNG